MDKQEIELHSLIKTIVWSYNINGDRVQNKFYFFNLMEGWQSWSIAMVLKLNLSALGETLNVESYKLGED